MAKTKAKAKAGKLAGMTIAFVGKFGYKNSILNSCQEIATSEGGTIVDPDQAALDYLVAGAGSGGNAPASVAKIQKKHPKVHVLDLDDFYKLTRPSPDEIISLLRAEPQEQSFWIDLQQR